ncbi:hypothetical protein [Cyanobacterium aponinum]|uniref:CTD-binding SR-like protein rA9 n=1 Tax=Cyanobacterium aponinum (strain PCC 10605) TaxID=755178 RepID=K9Z1L9_CYAAP|nr:hypothetical protein [Cyanobacterium aponinum]AFZ53059.1 CTD-binding SR-like protein rA9 [Cyanobacterium aponinum PCC 10605]
MKKLSNLLWFSGLLGLVTLGLGATMSESLAQIRGEDSDRFFRQGNEMMEEQIREIQRESVRQQQEEKAQMGDMDDMDMNDMDMENPENMDGFEEDRDEKETELETELEMKQPSGVELKEVEENPEGLDDNVPESPENEIEVQM